MVEHFLHTEGVGGSNPSSSTSPCPFMNEETNVPSRDELRHRVTASLRSQGFTITDDHIVPPADINKERIRELHALSVEHRRAKAKNSLFRFEDRLLARIAGGAEVDPARMSPRLIQVQSKTEDELLFRYASLHWSIPVSSGYGRRLRFLIVDDYNNKLIGILGLGDPVFSLGDRDRWIGWDRETRGRNLQNVMDAFALGAVPPYSSLLCGKLVAMLATSNEVRDAFKRKYGNRNSVIQEKKLDARLAMITTTSALGRSSVYNRVRFRDQLLYRRVGYTCGSGEFHFTNGLYASLSAYASVHCEATAKKEKWGTGFRNRREVIKKCLPKLGLSSDLLYHGIQREIFVIPMARNTQNFLCGNHSRLQWFNFTSEDINTYFKNRWLLPRSERDNTYTNWHPDSWRLWVK